MNQDTCAVITAVFPLVMLTIAVERRSIALGITRQKWFRNASVWALAASAIGLGTSIVGVQLNGLETGWAIVAWVTLFAALALLTVTLIAVLATAEVDEDHASKGTEPNAPADAASVPAKP